MNHTWEEMSMFSLKRKPSTCRKALSNLICICIGLMLSCMFREEQCKEAFIKFNGRWYAGRQLHCEMCPVTRWKNAICGQLLLLHYIWAHCSARALGFTTVPVFSLPLRSVWQTEVPEREALQFPACVSKSRERILGSRQGPAHVPRPQCERQPEGWAAFRALWPGPLAAPLQ